MHSSTQNFENIYQINAFYVEDMFARFQSNPGSVSPEWRAYFSGFMDGGKACGQYGSVDTQQGTTDAQSVSFALAVAKLVQNYKAFGHLKAKLNPLASRNDEKLNSTLSSRSLRAGSTSDLFALNTYNLTQESLARTTNAGALIGLPSPLTLGELIKALEQMFCSTVGAEIEHISNVEEREWLYSEYAALTTQPVAIETQKQIFNELARADALEKIIGLKYIGKKRFSIEGADSQIVALESYIDEATTLGTTECTIAIAHRGRLNFLVNVTKKPLANLFAEFEGEPNDNEFQKMHDGDVKYHYGYESVRKTRSGADIRIALSVNPSHLEYVDATVMGETRARQALYYNSDTTKVASVVFHGDAAVAGQGIVYEIAQMMSLRGYSVGGTIHVVANNQVGFTTNPKDARSALYCTNVARVTESPVFHVNGDDVESLHKIMKLAARYRAQFKKDIYIDILCFRRFGHNEGDEPSFTQPVLYKIIKDKPAPYETYLAQLVASGRFTENDLKTMYQSIRTEMSAVYDKVKAEHTKIEPFKRLRDAGKLVDVLETDILNSVDTRVSLEKLNQVAGKLTAFPQNFNINPKIERLVIQERKQMIDGSRPLDWGMSEMLAYATLLEEGYALRLTGEDTQRGTFSHRHAVLIDIENENEFSPLVSINPKQKTEIINSLLSEEATMGYEYGYSCCAVNTLNLWEAQFGDFANGAQVIIDQFIAAGETKWAQQTGLVLLLPHGSEGQGSEHSSARLERFLQLCAMGNMQVCMLTHATQIFHALRRQVKRNFRKPLVIMTPKSFLRSPRITTTLSDLSKSSFEEILDDARISNPESVTRVLFCSGKIAIDLFDALDTADYKQTAQSVAIIRIEQIYPLHSEKLAKIVARYSKAQTFAWVQEEPENMGAYVHLQTALTTIVQKTTPSRADVSPRADVSSRGLTAGSTALLYFGRSRRATPAVGLEKLYHREQKKLITAALTQKESAYI